MELPFLRIQGGLALKVQIGILVAMPTPLTIALCGLPAALLVTLIAPSRVPAVMGLNFTVRLQELPASSEGKQLELDITANSVMLLAMLVMLSATAPVLLSTMVCSGLVLPRC